MSVTRARGTSIGSLKKFSFSVFNNENNFSASPITLPTSEPATGQFVYTLQQSDMPVITPAPISLARRPIVVIMSGKMVTSGAVSYRILYNGTSVVTGTLANVAANTYWTMNAVNTAMAYVNPGDTIEVRLWSNQVDTTFIYSSTSVYPSRPTLTKAPFVKDLWFSGDNSGTFAQGTLSGQAWYIYCPYYTGTTGKPLSQINSLSTMNVNTFSNNIDYYFPILSVDNSASAYTFGGVMWGDIGYATNITQYTGTGTFPYYIRNHVPLNISFREVWLTK